MKISLAWLNTYLDRDATADELQQLLTDQGLPIEDREPVGGGDELLDVEITSNRSDCLSHVGIAREVAAGSGRSLQAPDVAPPPGEGDPVDKLTSVTNEATDVCPLYTARVIRGVGVGPSPAWLVQRLEAIGLRSVNNVVDVTNFVMFELGQPLHAFDMARLDGGRIVVRAARDKEAFTAIDNTRHALSPTMLVIADAARPVAVAGVMGGLESEVGRSTTDVLIESALFDPLSVRATSRSLKLASDSSYRFERGIDPAGVEAASARAAKLIVEVAGGTIAPGVIRAGKADVQPRRVTMRASRCGQLLGLDMPAEAMATHLDRLGFAPSVDGDVITCRVPTYRLDIEREVDLIEEVARLHGLDNIPMRERITLEVRPAQDEVRARRALRQTLVAHGYHETVTFSLVDPKHAKPFVPASSTAAQVDDERRKAEPTLRPSLLPSLLLCRKSNQDVGNSGVKLFETAATWCWRERDFVETPKLALIADLPDGEGGVREMRGSVEELVETLGGQVDLDFVELEHAQLQPAAEVRVDGRAVGVLGALSPATQRHFELQTRQAVAELDLTPLLALYPPPRSVEALARFPAIERDLSVVVDESVSWRQIEQHVLATEPALLERLRFLMTYRGKPIEKGRKSVSFRMLFRDPERTLRHEEVDPQVDAVVTRLRDQLGAELRG